MPSPFPGMDPYLEDPVFWPGFHLSAIAASKAALNRVLPSNYVADSGERVYVVQPDRNFYPDVLVERRPGPREETPGAGGVAVVDSTPTWVITARPEEHREYFVQIVSRKPERRVVTIIEFLSPSNKERRSEGRDQYLRKQRELLESDVHLVEVDLLRRGEHTIAAPLPLLSRRGRWDYLVCTHRSNSRWDYVVRPIQLREPLPQVAIPLSGSESEVILDLQAVFNQCYEEGRYAAELDYSRDPGTRPREEDWEWVLNRLRDRGLRP